MTDYDDLAPVPLAAAPHACAGDEGCYFCQWSNPQLELTEPSDIEGGNHADAA